MRSIVAAGMVILATLVVEVSVVRAGDVRLSSGVGGAATVSVVSYKNRPFLTVVRQQHDYSCGSAAVATLLTFHYNRPTTEREAFEAMYEAGDQAKIRRQGFSLLEMKNYLESLGYRADGFRVPLEKVGRVGVPVITLIEIRGYKHFVVIKGMQGSRILVGDPARGVQAMSLEKFKTVWKDDIVFAIHGADAIGRQHFNDRAEWYLRPPSPVGAGVDNTRLSSFTVMLPGPLSTFQ